MMLMIGTSAVDPCDVALIGANGSGSLVVLADGVNLLSALAPAAQAAAVDAAEGGADPLMLVLPSASGWTGPVYVGGQHVQRIAPANGVLGSSWSLRGGPPIFALNTTVAAGLALVDATGRCGGGGGGVVVPWAPVPTAFNATDLEVDYSSATRITDDEGDVVSIALGMGGICTADGTVEVLIPLPVNAEPSEGCVMGDPGNGSWVALNINLSGAGAQVTFVGTEEDDFRFVVLAQYEVEGV